MNITARGILTCLPLLIGLWFVSPTPAQSAVPSLKQQVIGHWQLVGIGIDGRTPFGEAPQGSMFIDAGGHLSVIVISDGGARSVSYFGTYTVNDADKTMSIHIDASSGGNGNASGRDLKRVLQVEGDQLTMTDDTRSGAPSSVKMLWKQAN